MKEIERRAEVERVGRAVHAEEGFRRMIVGLEAGPGEGDDGVVVGQLLGDADIGENGTVPCAAHDERHVVAAGADGFVTELERARTHWRQILRGIGRIDGFQKEILIVAMRRREAPCDMIVVSDHDERHARCGHAFHRTIRRLDADEIPLDRKLQAEMRIAGQQCASAGTS